MRQDRDILIAAVSGGHVTTDEALHLVERFDRAETSRDDVTTMVGNALSAIDDPAWSQNLDIDDPIGYATAMLCAALRILEPDTYSDDQRED